MKIPSRLTKSRHGIYKVRIQSNGLDRCISLRTRDYPFAMLAAYELGARILSMDLDKLKKLSFKDIKNWTIERTGQTIKLSTDGSQQDHENAILIAKELNLIHSSMDGQILSTTQQTTYHLKDILNLYMVELMKVEWEEKTRKMAISFLNKKFIGCLGASFDMRNFTDEVLNDIWLQPLLKTGKFGSTKKELSWIRRFAEWCANPTRSYCPAPLTLTIPKTRKVKSNSEVIEHYAYFSKSDLDKIFDNLHLQACLPWHIWIPLLALYTGARIGEIAGLQTHHFYSKMGIEAMHLPGTKTQCSPRDIPIHSDLLEIGLLQLVDARRKAGVKNLFDITLSEQNGIGAAPSKWFGAFLRKDAKIPEKDKVFHSFRHTLIDHLIQAGTPDSERRQYVGHSKGGDVHSNTYGRNPIGISALNERITSKINCNQYCGFLIDKGIYLEKANQLINERPKTFRKSKTDFN